MISRSCRMDYSPDRQQLVCQSERHHTLPLGVLCPPTETLRELLRLGLLTGAALADARAAETFEGKESIHDRRVP